jgi:glycerol-3-phosphate acyltransferase PlsY
MNTILILLLAYFCGAIPTGYWVVKAVKQVDLTKVGSGSTGTTNVLRTAGKAAAAFVFVVDVAKGYVPVLVAILALNKGWVPELANSPLGPWLPVASAILALVGHSKSIFLNWQGGKSAATGFGAMMAMNLPAALCAFAIFLTIVWLSRYVSLASVIAAGCAPILMYLFDPTAIPFIVLCLCGALYVIIRHKANIRRLMDGTESRIGEKADLTAGAKS